MTNSTVGIGTLLRRLLLPVIELDNGTAAELSQLAARLDALEVKANESHAATFAPMPTPMQGNEDSENA